MYIFSENSQPLSESLCFHKNLQWLNRSDPSLVLLFHNFSSFLWWMCLWSVFNGKKCFITSLSSFYEYSKKKKQVLSIAASCDGRVWQITTKWWLSRASFTVKVKKQKNRLAWHDVMIHFQKRNGRNIPKIALPSSLKGAFRLYAEKRQYNVFCCFFKWSD